MVNYVSVFQQQRGDRLRRISTTGSYRVCYVQECCLPSLTHFWRFRREGGHWHQLIITITVGVCGVGGWGGCVHEGREREMVYIVMSTFQMLYFYLST